MSRTTNATLSIVILVVAVTVARRLAEPMLSGDPGATPMADSRVILLILFAGILDVLGLLAFSYGLQHAETWLVGLASSFGPAVTIVIAVALLGERLKPIQWVGLAGVLGRDDRHRHACALERAARQAGTLNQKRVSPSADSAPTRPPSCSTSCLTMASPMPAPPRARSRDFSTR